MTRGAPHSELPVEVERAYAASQVSPWSTRAKIGRALWIVARATIFRFSWHNWYGVRRGILRCFGARIGARVNIRPTARIEIPWNLDIGGYSSVGDFAVIYNLGVVTIGRRVTISQYAQICAGTHDYTRPDLPLVRPPITIGDDAWIAASAFVGPGVTVGSRAVLGACGVAMKNLEPGMVYAGNPARPIKPRVAAGAAMPGGASA